MDEVLGKLTEMIVEAGLRAPADGRLRLPAERELAERLAVQRSTLRERLGTLEQLGVLERTQGSGTYVNLLNSDLIRLYFDLALALGFISTDEIEAARELFEREIARLAASIASKEDIETLTAICARMETASTAERCIAADYEFHMRLAHAARNPVITLIVEGLSSVLRRVLARRRLMVRSVPDAASRQNATHRPIVEALRRRDPESAMAAMDEHFRVTNDLQRKVTSVLLTSPGPERSGGTRHTEARRSRGPIRKKRKAASNGNVPEEEVDGRAAISP